MNRFAVVSDIHGNILALEAVAADLSTRSVEAVINLGDNLSGPLWPLETGKLLMQQNWLHVRGNHDRAMVFNQPAEHTLSERYAYQHINEEIKEWLKGLPPSLSLPCGILAFHGTPTIDNTSLLETPENHRARLATPSEINDRLGGVDARLILCGHTHFPRVVQHGSSLIICPASVGDPGYIDNAGEGHVIETGSPMARYAVVEERGDKWIVEQISLQYDHLSAARQAEKNGRPDWEISLRTGFMREGDETPYFPGL